MRTSCNCKENCAGLFVSAWVLSFLAMNKLYRYAYCPKCALLMWDPITCECGHTLCLSCAKKSLCICKSASQWNTVDEGPLIVNKKIQNITHQFFDKVISQTKWFEATKNLKAIKLDKTVKQYKRCQKLYSSRKITCNMNGSLRLGQLPSWLQQNDIECTICMETFTDPITTPCGHMFCRLCLDRLLYHSTSCPLCVAPLNQFDVLQTNETLYMSSVLFDLYKYKKPNKNQMYVPIVSLVCCVLPNVPNHLVFEINIFLWNLLSSPKKLLGVIPIVDGQDGFDYGTLVEVRDVLYLENGLCILTVVGSHRFEVLHRYRASGCLVGHIQKFYDTRIRYPSTGIDNNPIESHVAHFKIQRMLRLLELILKGAKRWYQSLPRTMQDNVASVVDISNLNLQRLNQSLECVHRHKQHGPEWIWQLITVLPVSALHKRMMLKSKDIETRLHTVYNILLFCCNSK